MEPRGIPPSSLQSLRSTLLQNDIRRAGYVPTSHDQE